jgi:hypothetical protein
MFEDIMVEQDLPVDVFFETVVRIEADVVDLLQVRPEIIRSRPVLHLGEAGSMMAAVSGAFFMVNTPQMPLKVIGGPEPLCSLATTGLWAPMWLHMPGDVLPNRFC